MRTSKVLAFKPTFETIVASIILGLSIVVNLIANLTKGTGLYYLLYHGVFILGICIFLPLWHVIKYNQESISELGITSNKWGKALAVGLLFVGMTVPFRFIDKDFLKLDFVFLYTVIGLAMTSLAEEIFFRGYLQTRYEKAFGFIPAVLLSGISFSLYHIGYSDFRGLTDLVVLLFVGIFFAAVFRITKNVITAFVLNFPHALVTFMEKDLTLPKISSFFAVIVIVIALKMIIGLANKRSQG